MAALFLRASIYLAGIRSKAIEKKYSRMKTDDSVVGMSGSGISLKGVFIDRK
jgi:hypothetical protein